jgi:hypothetical protein
MISFGGPHLDDEFSQIEAIHRSNTMGQANSQTQLEIELMDPKNAPVESKPTKIGSFKTDTMA